MPEKIERFHTRSEVHYEPGRFDPKLLVQITKLTDRHFDRQIKKHDTAYQIEALEGRLIYLRKELKDVLGYKKELDIGLVSGSESYNVDTELEDIQRRITYYETRKKELDETKQSQTSI